jgi:predicted NACHT family NTPase
LLAAGLAGWFIGLGKKAGEEFAGEFGKVFGNNAAEWIRDHCAPFKMRYQAYLSDLVRHVDLKGFAQDTPFALDLIDVFVDLSLDPKSLRNIPASAIQPLPEALATGRHSIWEYLEQPDQRLAIIGSPGSGKTTLLKHIILSGCRLKTSKSHKAARALPIFIEIRKHAKAIGDKPDYGIADAALDQFGSFGRKASKRWFDSKLEGGGCVVLIDGLDEVANTQLRQTVVNWVEKQIAAYPRIAI